MKVEAHAELHGSPEAKFKTRSGPLGVKLEGSGSLEVKTEDVTGHVGQIPVWVTIPFLKRNGGVVAVGAIGPFGVRLDPMQATINAFGVCLNGVLGPEGLSCEMEAVGSGKIHVDVEANMPPGFLKAVVKELVEE